MDLKLTVIIRDEAPMRYMGEPVELRSVTVYLTPEQQEQLRLRTADESVRECFLEPT